MRIPYWIKDSLERKTKALDLKQELGERKLHTICEEAKCPNIGECYNSGTATFLILGDTCTRNCGFCAVKKGVPEPVDTDESERIALQVKEMELSHVVITSPSRDDLPDGGAEHFARTVREIGWINENTTVEVLIPDFEGDFSCVEKVIDSGIDVLNHNVETVPSLYSEVRPEASYERSLDLIEMTANKFPELPLKSGIMVGLGEEEEEVFKVMRNLNDAGCNILTVGQYLRPSGNQLPVKEYIRPEVFKEYREIGLEMGFDFIVSGPLVRSSYMAEKAFKFLNPSL